MLKVAILGFGFMGKTHADAYLSLPNVCLVGVGDVRTELFTNWNGPSSVKFFNNLDSLLAKVDADILDVCLPTFLHEEFVIKAAKRGMHILCEKPLALDVASADRILAAVRETGGIFMVGQVVRFSAHYVKARELVQSGTCGNVIFTSAFRLSEPPQWARWFSDPQKSGGALYDLHIHDLDYIVDLFGNPEALLTTGVQSKGGCWDQVVDILLYPDKKVVIEASYRMPVGWPFATYLRIVGTSGCVEYGFRVQGNMGTVNQATHSFTLYRDGELPEDFEIHDPTPYLTEVKYFVDCVEHNQQPTRVTPEQSRNVIAVLEAAKRSLETGAVVQLDELGAPVC